MTITYPLLTVTDDSGAVVAGATVTIASVKDKSGTDIASHGATLNQSGANVSVDYDAEAKGEGWLVLAISKVGSTFTGTNAAPAFYLSRDSGRALTALPAVAAGANGGLPTGDASGRVLLQPTQAGVTIPTVTTTATATNLTNLPVAPTDWLTAAAVKADAVTKIQGSDYAASAVGANSITLATGDARRLTSQVGKRALITGGTAGVGQVGVITASNTSTFVQTIADGWDASVTPTGSPVTYDILPAASAGADPDAVASAVADSLGDAAVVGTVAGSPSPTALSFTLTGLPTGVPAAAYVGRRLFAQDAAALAGFGFAIATATSSVAGTVAVTIASGSVAPTSAPSAGTIYHIYP